MYAIQYEHALYAKNSGLAILHIFHSIKIDCLIDQSLASEYDRNKFIQLQIDYNGKILIPFIITIPWKAWPLKIGSVPLLSQEKRLLIFFLQQVLPPFVPVLNASNRNPLA